MVTVILLSFQKANYLSFETYVVTPCIYAWFVNFTVSSESASSSLALEETSKKVLQLI